MVQLFLITALLIAISAVIFALQNSVPVTVSFLIWKFESSLALVLLISLGLGVLVSFLLSIPTMIKRNWTISNYKKRIQELEQKNQGMKSASPENNEVVGSPPGKS
jgi:putative membrane protein